MVVGNKKPATIFGAGFLLSRKRIAAHMTGAEREGFESSTKLLPIGGARHKATVTSRPCILIV